MKKNKWKKNKKNKEEECTEENVRYTLFGVSPLLHTQQTLWPVRLANRDNQTFYVTFPR